MRAQRTSWIVAGLALIALLIAVPASAEAADTDLRVTQSDNPDPVTEGDVVAYAIRVTNLGPGLAGEATVTDKLSTELTLLSATTSQGTCKTKARSATCELGQLTAYDGAATVRVRARARKVGQASSVATVALGKPDTDPNAANDSATETTTVRAAGGGGAVFCGGERATIVGTSGPDVITGTAGRDVIKTGAGRDRVRGLSGKDIVCGGRGADKLRGGGGNDRLKGGAGRDVLRGGGGNDRLAGGPNKDRCSGGPGKDTKRSC